MRQKLVTVLGIVSMASWLGVAYSQVPSSPIQVGQKARDFALKTLDGKMFHLASFADKKIVVLGIGNPFG